MADSAIEQLIEEENSNQPAPAATPEPKPEEEPDYEDELLRAALEEEEREKNPDATPAPAPEPTPAPAAAEAAPKTPEPKQEPSDSPMIPKARLDQVLAEKDEMARRAAFLEGQLHQLQTQATQPATPAAPEEPPKTPDEIIAEARVQKQDLAKKYDDAELTAAEYEASKDRLDDIIAEAREAKLAQRFQPQPTTPSQRQQTGEDLYLDQLTAKLETDHPYTLEIAKDDPRWKFLEDEANRQLQQEGIALMPGARGLYTLRERMAVLTDQYGPMWTGKSPDQIRGQAPNPGTGPAPTPAPGLSPTAKARMDKLDMAEQQPPSTTSLGGSGASTEVSEADINAMSDDEIAALPESTRRKFLAT